jgi:hypothetical protein
VVLEQCLVLAVQEAVEVVLLQPVELVLLVLLIQEVVLVVEIGLALAGLAAQASSSCPTPCQKVQQLNSCLLRPGQRQQELPLLTI